MCARGSALIELILTTLLKAVQWFLILNLCDETSLYKSKNDRIIFYF